MSTIDSKKLRRAFGAFMTGVTVVTADNGAGVKVGFTANSFTSVSLEPPLVLVCAAHSMTCFDVFAQVEHFAINVLSEEQQDISNVFASGVGDRFANLKWRADAAQCPLIEGASATFSCEVFNRFEAGDHQVLIGRVTDFASHDMAGLGYANQGYFSLGLERHAAELTREMHSLGHNAKEGAIVEHDGKILLQSSSSGWRPPQVTVNSQDGSLSALRQHFNQVGLAASFGPVYSIFEDRRTGDYVTYYRATSNSPTTGGLGQYVDLKKIDQLEFDSVATREMLTRYVLERRDRVFGLDLDDEDDGDLRSGQNSEEV